MNIILYSSWTIKSTKQQGTRPSRTRKHHASAVTALAKTSSYSPSDRRVRLRPSTSTTCPLGQFVAFSEIFPASGPGSDVGERAGPSHTMAPDRPAARTPGARVHIRTCNNNLLDGGLATRLPQLLCTGHIDLFRRFRRWRCPDQPARQQQNEERDHHGTPAHGTVTTLPSDTCF